jgi:hypothetical protein
MNITSITLITGNGADHLLLQTDLPDGCWPYTDNATVKMETAAGTGEEYCIAHFTDVPLKIFNNKDGEIATKNRCKHGVLLGFACSTCQHDFVL